VTNGQGSSINSKEEDSIEGNRSEIPFNSLMDLKTSVSDSVEKKE